MDLITEVNEKNKSNNFFLLYKVPKASAASSIKYNLYFFDICFNFLISGIFPNKSTKIIAFVFFEDQLRNFHHNDLNGDEIYKQN